MIAPADVERYHAAALELADEARRLIVPAMAASYEIGTKADASVVTEVDRAVERRLRDLIGRWFPDHGVVGEEYPATGGGSALRWILDPIDGTEEFVHGIPTFGTLLALHDRETALVGVIDHAALDLRVHAAVGLGAHRNGTRIRLADATTDTRAERVRMVMTARLNFTRGVDEGHLFDALARRFPNHRIFRAAYAHTAVVSGAADVMVDMHNHIWDLAPAKVLIEEAGGRYAIVREFDAPDGERLISAVFGRPAIVDRVVTVFQEGTVR